MELFQKFGKSLSIFFLFNVLSASVPILLLPFLANHLSPAEYGILSMYTTVSAILTAFIGLSTNSAISIKYFHLEKEELYTYVGSTFTILLISTIAIIFICFCLQQFIESITGLNFFWIATAILFCSFQFVFQIILNILQASTKAFLFGCLQFVALLANLALVYVLISLFRYGWEGRIYSQVAIAFVCFLFSILFLYKKKTKFINFKYTRDALKFSTPLIPHSLAGTIFNFADRIMINKFLSAASLGIYTIGFQIGSGITIFSDAYAKSLLPFINIKLKENTQDSLVQLTKVFLYSICASILLLGASIVAVHYLFGLFIRNPDFNAAKGLIFFFFLGNTLHGIYYNFVGILFAFERTKIIARVTLITSVFSLTLMYVALKYFNLYGLLYVYVLNRATILSMVIYYANKCIKLPWRSAFENFFKK